MRLILNPQEFEYAALGGFMRRISALNKNRQRENGRTDSGFDRDVVGAVAEYAVAKWLNIFWSPKPGELDTLTGDLPGVQVKSITNPNHNLIVQTDDLTCFNYILAHVQIAHQSFSVNLLGWIDGWSVSTVGTYEPVNKERNIHQAAWFIPRSKLNHVSNWIAQEESASRYPIGAK